jgi:acetyltransferase-like isoleucine patch superfamily enzyme
MHYSWEEHTNSRFGYCGEGVYLAGFSKFVQPSQIRLGDNVFIGGNAWFRAGGPIEVGDNTQISRYCAIFAASHNYKGTRLPYDDTLITKPVRIGRNVWIGMNANSIPGVTIGDGAIVALGTTVVKDVPPLAIVGGAEQRVLGYRDKMHYESLDSQGHTEA